MAARRRSAAIPAVRVSCIALDESECPCKWIPTPAATYSDLQACQRSLARVVRHDSTAPPCRCDPWIHGLGSNFNEMKSYPTRTPKANAALPRARKCALTSLRPVELSCVIASPVCDLSRRVEMVNIRNARQAHAEASTARCLPEDVYDDRPVQRPAGAYWRSILN